MDRFDELLSEYLDGTLDAAGRAELASIVEADSARRAELVDLVRVGRILAAEFGAPPELTRGVLAELEKGKSGFVRAVMRDVRGGGTKTPPRPRRAVAPPAPVWQMWVAFAAGATIVLGLLIFAVGGESDPVPLPRQVKLEKRKESPVPEAKVEEPAPPPKPEPLPEPPKPPLPSKSDAPKPEPVSPSPTPKPEAPAPKREPEAPRSEPRVTVVEVASLDRVEGDVVLARGGQRKPAQTGDPVLAGDVVESGGTAVVKYADGTKVELRSTTAAGFPAAEGGKRIVVDRGSLRAQVSKQPAGLAMVFQTPHGDATVLGTTLRLVVDPDPKEGTRLDVEEGKVRLLRKLDGKSVEVSTGHYAVVAAGMPLASRLFRVSSGIQALYTFKEGKGGIVHDVARVGAPLDLKIENEQGVRWSPRGLLVSAPTLIASPAPATRISQACKAANEITLEAWFRPATVTPATKDGRIVVLSSDTKNQNFLLGQDGLMGPPRSYFMRLRTTTTDLVGKPDLVLPEGSATPKLTHLVYTRAASGTAMITVDGVESTRSTVAGNLSAWNDGYRLGLANEFTNDRAWLGEYQLVAIYSRALSLEEIRQNLKAGSE